MRNFTALAILFCLITLTGTPSVAAQTLDQRVKALEGKTNYYKINRRDKTKTWKNKQAFRSATTRDGIQRFDLDTSYSGDDPVVINAWITVTGSYDIDTPFDFAIVGGIAAPNGIQANTFCVYDKDRPAGAEEINLKYFCQGLLNPQAGDVFRVEALFDAGRKGTISIPSLTITTHIVSQVITEPPQ